MVAREVRRSADLRYDGRTARDLGVGDHATLELASDDAYVGKRLAPREVAARLEERETGGRPAPAGRAVDLAVGGDRDVPLAEAAARRRGVNEGGVPPSQKTTP